MSVLSPEKNSADLEEVVFLYRYSSFTFCSQMISMNYGVSKRVHVDEFVDIISSVILAFPCYLTSIHSISLLLSSIVRRLDRNNMIMLYHIHSCTK